MGKKRLDDLLVERRITADRQKATAIIRKENERVSLGRWSTTR